jgi:cytochrome oxidase Cu insertion factor (SCO1/SenC/PrrC family)
VVYLIDRQGILRYRVAHGTPPGEIAQQVAKLLDEA